MLWQAKFGCAEHHRAAVERIVNAYPPAWLLPPQSGELFNNLDDCNYRLRGYTFAEGFNIVRKKRGAKKTLVGYFVAYIIGVVAPFRFEG